MKQISNKIKTTCAILLIILVAATIMVAIMGFNVERQYRERDTVVISIGEKIEINKAKEIAKNVLGNKYITVQYVDNYQDIIQISGETITTEQKNDIVSKINTLYGWTKQTEEVQDEAAKAAIENDSNKAIDAEKIEITRMPNINIWDLLKPYIFAMLITTLFILVYVGIRFFKYSTIKAVAITIAALALSQFAILSLMAITRFPIGRFTSAIMLLTYMITLVEVIRYVENKAKTK